MVRYDPPTEELNDSEAQPLAGLHITHWINPANKTFNSITLICTELVNNHFSINWFQISFFQTLHHLFNRINKHCTSKSDIFYVRPTVKSIYIEDHVDFHGLGLGYAHGCHSRTRHWLYSWSLIFFPHAEKFL